MKILKPIGKLICRVLFSVSYYGLEKIPTAGPVIIAANHPSYLDPVLIGVNMKRTLRYMAWDALFKIPIFGQFIRAMGAFPVDIRKGKGEAAFLKSLEILNAGHALCIFPEGQRSELGSLGELKGGAARLAIDSGAPIIPVTIGGASRAWPKYKLLPKPAQIIVRFHEPIVLDEKERNARTKDKEYQREIMQQVAIRINKSLGPSLRVSKLTEQWYQSPPSHVRLYEWAPLIAAVIATIISRKWNILIYPAIYYLYIAADLTLIKQRRISKWIRNTMPVWLIVAWHYSLTNALAIPNGEHNVWLLTSVLIVLFPFFYEDYYTLQKFIRGLTVGYYLSLAIMLGIPHPLGALTTTLVFISIFVFWYRVIFRKFIAILMSVLLLILAATSLKDLYVFVILGAVLNIYLKAFISAAYDIRFTAKSMRQ